MFSETAPMFSETTPLFLKTSPLFQVLCRLERTFELKVGRKGAFCAEYDEVLLLSQQKCVQPSFTKNLSMIRVFYHTLSIAYITESPYLCSENQTNNTLLY